MAALRVSTFSVVADGLSRHVALLSKCKVSSRFHLVTGILLTSTEKCENSYYWFKVKSCLF